MAGKPGRRVEWTPEIGRHIAEKIEAGNWRVVAARSAKIPAMTFRNWLKFAYREDAPPGMLEWAERIKAAEAVFESTVVEMIAGAVGEGDVRAAMWLVERRFPKRWGQKSEVKSKVETTQKLDKQGLTEEEFDAEMLKLGYQKVKP